MEKRNKLVKSLVIMYNNLTGTNPIRVKDLLSVGLSVPVTYKIIRLLVREGIMVAEAKGYKVDWEKFRLFLTQLI